MAYKFQMGDARLSGSVRQEGTIRADQKSPLPQIFMVCNCVLVVQFASIPLVL